MVEQFLSYTIHGNTAYIYARPVRVIKSFDLYSATLLPNGEYGLSIGNVNYH